ncbi:plasmid stabilization system family protein [Chlamydia ibidis]|uniref:Plasmid stabilization system family protein n=2 Tax=Chlamydia ibidis TaxID=1405396 RepID=S7KHD1_9CHLA|nr:type II toxin-antitoxin system RelE/ParE family toxin [Chlamydia ibidis]EPP35586.1 plasmid stabilization system family protein [Chlamydia ibidis]EQM62663.1 plasmid stabilization system family protein [Chlamydia ibidis 10-1398/6]
MIYAIEITDKVAKKLLKFPKKDKERIVRTIDSLSESPRPQGVRKLRGIDKLTLLRIRVGKYRIVYTIQDDLLLVLIIDVDHRKDIYSEY